MPFIVPVLVVYSVRSEAKAKPVDFKSYSYRLRTDWCIETVRESPLDSSVPPISMHHLTCQSPHVNISFMPVSHHSSHREVVLEYSRNALDQAILQFVLKSVNYLKIPSDRFFKDLCAHVLRASHLAILLVL